MDWRADTGMIRSGQPTDALAHRDVRLQKEVETAAALALAKRKKGRNQVYAFSVFTRIIIRKYLHPAFITDHKTDS